VGLEIPAEVQWLSWIVGTDWPEGDETAMRRCAEAWHQAASDVNELIPELQRSAANVLSSVQGAAADSFEQYWEKFVASDPQYIPKLVELCESLASQVEQGALDIEYAKYMFIALLIITAIEIAMLIASAFATFGASTAAIPAVEAAAQVTARTIFQRLLIAIARHAAIGALQGAGLDVLIQGIQIAKGDREGLDLKKTALAGMDGAIGGAISGGVGHGLGHAPGLGGVADSAAGNMVRGAARGAIAEGVSGVGSTLAGAAIHGEPLTLEGLAKGATSGAFGGGVGGARDGLNTYNDAVDGGPGTAGADGNSPAVPEVAPVPDFASADGGSSDSGGTTGGGTSGGSSDGSSGGSTGSSGGSASGGSSSGEGGGSSYTSGGSSGGGGSTTPAGSGTTTASYGDGGSAAPSSGGSSPYSDGASYNRVATTLGGDAPASGSAAPSTTNLAGSAPAFGGGAGTAASPAAFGDGGSAGTTSQGGGQPVGGGGGVGTTEGGDGGSGRGGGASAGGASPGGGAGGGVYGGAPGGSTPGSAGSPGGGYSGSPGGAGVVPPGAMGGHPGAAPAGPRGQAPSTSADGTPGDGAPAPEPSAATAPSSALPPPGPSAPETRTAEHSEGGTPAAVEEGPGADMSSDAEGSGGSAPSGAVFMAPPIAPAMGGPGAGAGGRSHSAGSTGGSGARLRFDSPDQRPVEPLIVSDAAAERAASGGAASPGEGPPGDRPADQATTGRSETDDQPVADDATADEAARPGEGEAVPSGLPEHLHEVYGSSEATPAGRSLYGPDEQNMRDLARRVQADPNQYVLDGHGTPDGVRAGGRTLNARDVADIIRNDPNWNGREVLLLSCDTGREGAAFAAALAGELGVPVVAPDGLAWSDNQGRVFSASSSGPPAQDGSRSPTWPPDGDWNTFRPDGSSAPAGDRGFAPSRPGDTAAAAAVPPEGAAARDAPTDRPPEEGGDSDGGDWRAPLDEWRQGEGADWRDEAVQQVADEYGLADNPEAVRALSDAYEVVRDHMGPFVVEVANRMLEDFRARVAEDPGHRIVFVGRDGEALALAVRGLDPDFFERHCSEVTVSRKLAELALLDAEARAGRKLLNPPFRWRGIEQADVLGSYELMQEYLRGQGVPIDRAGSSVTMVDSSFKGTVQEMLSATFPGTEFQGAYIWHGAAAGDPHPGTKTGYAQHLEWPRDPADRGNIWETLVYEDALRGVLSSPARFGPDGQPEQHATRFDDDAMEGLSPARVSDRFADGLVRDAIRDINQRAIEDYARRIAGLEDPDAELAEGFQAFGDQVGNWWRNEGEVNPAFSEFLDSFVRREDWQQVKGLEEHIARAGSTDEEARSLRETFDGLGSLAAKREFLDQIERA
jgi:uncharacterized membrane protein YgcG